MFRSGQLRYTAPPPPHQSAIEANRPTRTPRALVWRIEPHRRAAMLCGAAPCSRVIASWTCPMCSTPLPRRWQAGRHRVYCTNSCKQRAYRHRCEQRRVVPMSTRRHPRPIRATTSARIHAMREFGDVVSGHRDSSGRGVTACGAFALVASDRPERFGHVRFVGADPQNATTCRTCSLLSGAPPATGNVSWEPLQDVAA